MKTALTALAILAIAGACLAGEKKPTKEERIAAVTQELAKAQKSLAASEKWAAEVEQDAKLGEKAKYGGNAADNARAQLAFCRNRAESARLELAWLEGKLTKKGCDEKVKTAEETVKKAEESKADEKTLTSLKVAVEVAKKELAAVEKFEARGEF